VELAETANDWSGLDEIAHLLTPSIAIAEPGTSRHSLELESVLLRKLLTLNTHSSRTYSRPAARPSHSSLCTHDNTITLR